MKDFSINKIIIITIIACISMSCENKDEIKFSFDPVANINFLWETIDTKYCYIEEKNIDWNRVGEEYREKAKYLTTNPIELFDLCSSMLDSLKDGHVNLYTDFDISRTDLTENYDKNYKKELQELYFKNYRIAGGLYYCKIDSAIGYIYYPSFEQAINNHNLGWINAQFKDCRGLILDIRENGGGDLSYAHLLASYFFDEDKVVGYWQHKTGKGHNDFSKMEEITIKAKLTTNKWHKKAVILTNRRCYSATNFFINCIKGYENIKIIGDISGGGGGMPMSYEMPCGWLIRFSSIKMLNCEKKSIENGIEPDIYVTLKSENKDDLIEKGIELINNELW